MLSLFRASSRPSPSWRHRAFRACTAVAVTVLAACGGDGGTPPAAATISLSLATPLLTVARGASGTTSVTLARNNYSDAVTLTSDAPPSGVTVSFSPASLAAGATSAVATVAVAPTAAPGTYSIVVTASGAGVASTSSVISLTVPAPGLSLSAGAGNASVVQGANTTVPLTITRTGGFTDAVTLSASGLPTGVTASFAPASIASGSATSTLTLTAGGNTPVGTSTVTITASGTGVSSTTTTVSLTVTAAPTPAITLTAGAGTSSIVRGLTTTVALTITRAGGYTGAVDLAISGLPNGVTAAFAPASIPNGSSTSTLTLTASSTAALGTAPFTVTATGSGVTAQTATVNLTVTAAATPAIALAAAPAAVSVQAGGTGTSTLTVTRSGGFTGDVALTVSGAPNGITTTLSPATVASGSTSSVLAIAVGAGTNAGQYNLVVSATGTGVTATSTTVTLTVGAVPAIAVSLSPAALTVAPGGTATSTVTLTRTNFTADVALAMTSLPTGVTASFAPATLSGGTLTSVVTLTATASAVIGAATPVVTATGTGVTAATASLALTVSATPTIAVSANPTTVSIAAGSTATSVITLARTNFTGDVVLSATNLPTGVSASFAPPTLTGSTLTSTVTLTALGTAAPATGSLTVNATGTGVTSATASIAYTVTAAPAIAIVASPTTVSFAAGANATSTITLTRTNFTGTVTLATGALPSGVTAVFSAPTLSGTTLTSTLTLSAPSGTAATTGNVTVTASGSGVTSATASVGVTVTSSGGSGGGNVTWTFCSADRFPSWFAYQNGTGPWTTVTPTGTSTRVYAFSVGATGAVAYATPVAGSTGRQVTIQYLSQSELVASGTQECTANRATKSLTGSVANVPAGATGNIGIGGAIAAVSGPQTAFTLTGVPLGATDLLAFRSTINFTTFVQAPDRGILRRNVDYATTVPLIDFTGSESFVPASAQYTIGNVGADQLQIISGFSTANGTAGTFVFGALTGATSPATVYGVPNNLVQSGDQHQVFAIASSGSGTSTSARIVYQYNQQLANRTITLGGPAPLLTPTSLGSSPYVRFTATGSWSSEYADAVGIGYTQAFTNSNSWSISMSRTYSGSGGTFTMTIPDFSGVSGFQNSWGLASSSTNFGFSATGYIFGLNPATGTFGEGGSFRVGSRTGTVSP